MKRLGRRLIASGKSITHPSRLLVAGKTAVAATAAWLIGRSLPGVAEYAYYAPFGALVAMTPTVASSFGSAVKTLTGVVLGLVAAWGLVLLGIGGAFALPLAIAIGTLLAGIPWLGAARDFVPLAAAFAFLVGGASKEEFSVGFIGHLAVGAGLGILVNLALPPPLGVRQAASTVDLVGDTIIRCLEDTASVLRESDTSPARTWANTLDEVDVVRADARAALSAVAKARRGNIRTRRRRNSTATADRDLRRYELIMQQMREMTQPLAGVVEAMSDVDVDGGGTKAPAAAALTRVADVLRARREDAADVEERVAAASEAIGELERAGDRSSSERSDIQRLVVLASTLQRIVAAAADTSASGDGALPV